MQVIYPLITSLVALFFAVLVLRQYLQRRGLHQLSWAAALFVFSFAAFCEFYSEVWGWPVLLYKVYYVAAAALVAYLGLGTIYLIWKRRAGNIWLGIFLTLTTIMLIVALTAPVDTVALQPPLLAAAHHPWHIGPGRWCALLGLPVLGAATATGLSHLS